MINSTAASLTSDKPTTSLVDSSMDLNRRASTCMHISLCMLRSIVATVLPIQCLGGGIYTKCCN